MWIRNSEDLKGQFDLKENMMWIWSEFYLHMICDHPCNDHTNDPGDDDGDPYRVVEGTQWSTEQIITVQTTPPTHIRMMQYRALHCVRYTQFYSSLYTAHWMELHIALWFLPWLCCIAHTFSPNANHHHQCQCNSTLRSTNDLPQCNRTGLYIAAVQYMKLDKVNRANSWLFLEIKLLCRANTISPLLSPAIALISDVSKHAW